MTLTEFQAQCLALLNAAREWPDEQWEQLEESCSMGVLDAIIDLENELETTGG